MKVVGFLVQSIPTEVTKNSLMNRSKFWGNWNKNLKLRIEREIRNIRRRKFERTMNMNIDK